MDKTKAVIGPSIVIKGELIGKEDLAIEGRVEGNIRLSDNELLVGQKARIDATLEAKIVRVEGEVRGDILASERVELAPGSQVSGDIVSPRIAIADGARFKGSVDMDRSKGGSSTKKPAAQPVGTASRPSGSSAT